jgi:type II secretory pathway component GspD/PulD (secretin)
LAAVAAQLMPLAQPRNPKFQTLFNNLLMNVKKIAIAVMVTGFGLMSSRAQVVNAPQVVPAILPTAAQIPFGPVLDVIPYVSADGYSIEMSIVPTLTEFLGYDSDVAQTFRTIVGNQQLQPTPLPRFRVRQIVTSANVWDGQTVVLGGLIAENVSKTKDKVPVLGDIPFLGRLFRSERSISEKRNLVVFVTPKLIDPAGNRVHSPESLPYDPNVIPPQGPTSSARPLAVPTNP